MNLIKKITCITALAGLIGCSENATAPEQAEPPRTSIDTVATYEGQSAMLKTGTDERSEYIWSFEDGSDTMTFDPYMSYIFDRPGTYKLLCEDFNGNAEPRAFVVNVAYNDANAKKVIDSIIQSGGNMPGDNPALSGNYCKEQPININAPGTLTIVDYYLPRERLFIEYLGENDDSLKIKSIEGYADSSEFRVLGILPQTSRSDLESIITNRNSSD
jgi:hypothetical protein